MRSQPVTLCTQPGDVHASPVWGQRLARLGLSLALSVGVGRGALAQERLGVEPPRRPGPVEPAFPAPPDAPVLPRPALPPPPAPPAEGPESLTGPRLFVRQIEVTGSSVFSEAALAAVTRPYVDRYVTSEELETLRLALTRLYVEAGYINSGAVLPDQDPTGGVIRFHMIEGALTELTIDGRRWFRDRYLRQRLTLGVTPPLQIAALQERLQLLQQDERIARVEAALRPGARPGEGALQVQITERPPWFVALEFNNYQSPPIGAERGLITVAHRNVTGHGDVVSVTYGRSAGLDLQLDAGYTLPLTPRETTFNVRYRRNDSSVIEEQVQDLDIESRSEIFSVTLRQPVYRTPRREVALALSAERLQSRTLVQGAPFPFFTPSAQRGVTTDTAVRVTAEWLDRTPQQVLAVRSRLSFGVDVLGATGSTGPDQPDGRFFAWLGQVQWGRRLPLGEVELLARADVQLTADPLLPLEQMALGGRFSVRGYRENQLVRDNGAQASLEARIPLVRETPWAEVVQVIPFVDVGVGWNQQRPTPDPKTLVSVGLGVRWAATFQAVVPLRAQAEIFWGYKLKQVTTTGGDLQDKGVHLQVVVAAF